MSVIIDLVVKYGAKVLTAAKNFLAWYSARLKDDWFAHVIGYLFLVTLSVNAWQYLHPKKVDVTNTVSSIPVTITKTITVHQSYIGGGVQITPKGEVKQKNYGLCFIPSVGAVYVRGKSFSPSVSVRPIFWKNFGAHFGGNIYGPMIGLDYQIARRWTLMAQAGTCPEVSLPVVFWRPYVGLCSGIRF